VEPSIEGVNPVIPFGVEDCIWVGVTSVGPGVLSVGPGVLSVGPGVLSVGPGV